VGQPGIAAVEAGMLKMIDMAACLIELDCVGPRLSSLHLDSSRRNWDDHGLYVLEYGSLPGLEKATLTCS
jgi:hypothetical protein